MDDVNTDATPEISQNNQQEIQNRINNEMRFAEETVIRALRACVISVVNILNANSQNQG
jgi:hypothetical protein